MGLNIKVYSNTFIVYEPSFFIIIRTTQTRMKLI